MEQGRQIEAGSASESSDKVVRLPRDWLGPREDLVPFGHPPPPPPELEPDPASFAPNDFWGERAAAIHSAVQAPDDEAPPKSLANKSAPNVRLGRRRLAAAALAGLAVVAALALVLGGSPNHVTGGARLNIAAIVDGSVLRILKTGPPRVVARTPSPPPVRHVRHHSARPKTPPVRPQHHTTPPPASTYVAHAYRSSPQPTYRPAVSSPTPHIVTSSHRSAATTSSRATVSATGQNGALGPVQSPNG